MTVEGSSGSVSSGRVETVTMLGRRDDGRRKLHTYAPPQVIAVTMLGRRDGGRRRKVSSFARACSWGRNVREKG